MKSLSYFNDIADQWNQMRKSYFDEGVYDCAITNSLVGKAVGDFGAGTGFMTFELAKEATTVFAVDQSRNMLHELATTAKANQVNNVIPVIGAFETIPLLDHYLDAVYSNMAMHHVEEPVTALKEMYRTLKPGSEVVITDVERHDGTWAITEMHDVWLGFTHEQMAQWLSQVGFEDISVKSSGLHCQGYSSKGEFIQIGILIAKAKKPFK